MRPDPAVDVGTMRRYAAGMGILLCMKRGATVLAVSALAGCANFSIGLGLPVGGLGSVGVSVGSDGRVGGSVSVGSGPVSVGVGGSTQLPRSPEKTASAPAP